MKLAVELNQRGLAGMDTLHRKRNCTVASCGRAAITSLGQQVLCVNHFLLRCYEKLDGLDPRGRKFTGEPIDLESVTVSSVGRSSTHTSPGRWTARESTPTARAAPPVWAACRASRPPARNAPPSPMRERACQVSESRVPRAAAKAAENPNMPWAIESRLASSANVGAGPGCQVK